VRVCLLCQYDICDDVHVVVWFSVAVKETRLTQDSNLFITLIHLLVFYYLPVSKTVICCILNSLLHSWFYCELPADVHVPVDIIS